VTYKYPPALPERIVGVVRRLASFNATQRAENRCSMSLLILNALLDRITCTHCIDAAHCHSCHT